MRDYLERANDEVLAIGTIEHIDAVNSVADLPPNPVCNSPALNGCESI
jgi:hypothetical protein